MKGIPYKIHPSWASDSPDVEGAINIRGKVKPMARTAGYRKITHGYVSQIFDVKTGKCVEQEFTAGHGGGDCEWEDENDEFIDEPEGVEYQSFDMVQPIPRKCSDEELAELNKMDAECRGFNSIPHKEPSNE